MSAGSHERSRPGATRETPAWRQLVRFLRSRAARWWTSHVLRRTPPPDPRERYKIDPQFVPRLLERAG